MKHNPQIWRLALEALDRGTPAALLYVVESLGSSPGRAGFAMTVTPDRAAGSIGGGAMEFRFLSRVRQLLGQGDRGFLQRQVHDAEAAADASGMICSGEQTFWVTPLGPSDRPAVAAVVATLDGPRAGVIRLDAHGLSFSPHDKLAIRYRYQPGPEWSYEEDWGHRDRLHLVGGGHCALALSQLAAHLDFEITVYDDRPGLATFDANTWAHRKVLVPDYSVMGDQIPEGPDEYVCVMTFGYKTDDVALRALMHRSYGFLGALGSRMKIDRLMAAYQQEGVAPEVLRRLHAPLGLPIHSQTPAEIAVSIAAQLIRVRNEPRQPTDRSAP